jgi:hypothetical protein
VIAVVEQAGTATGVSGPYDLKGKSDDLRALAS